MLDQPITIVTCIDFLDAHNGALMVVITLVYVMATVLIWIANNKSAQATKDQLEESKRQFEESTRINHMPCIQIKKTDERDNIHGNIICRPRSESEYIFKNGFRKSYFFSVYNFGHDIAKDIHYHWLNAENLDDAYVVSLSVNDNRSVRVDFYIPANYNNTYCFNMLIQYEDLLGNDYAQTVTFVLDVVCSEISLRTYSITVPELENKETTHA